jgi:methylmalonyl-CoA/ethylmalonyl-CoA epimerase
MKFHHIGIFVNDLKYGNEILSGLHKIVKSSEVIFDNNLKVKIQFLTDEFGLCYELVAPYGIGNPVENLLKSGKNILNHIAYQVQDFEASYERLRNLGCIPITLPQPAVAFGGSRVVFFITKLRYIIELIEF